MRLRRCRRAPLGFDLSASEAEELKQNVFNTPSESCTELVFRLGTYLFRESLERGLKRRIDSPESIERIHVNAEKYGLDQFILRLRLTFG